MHYDDLLYEANDSGREFWNCLDPDLEDIHAVYEDNAHMASDVAGYYDLPTQSTNIIDMRALPTRVNRFKPGFKFRPAVSFYMLRSALMTHFYYQNNIGDFQWPRNMSSVIK